ncbi:cytochrome P450 306a1 [Cylas formicarius]|uniref:cytochrome P450 306a1 n=1 Tax=Cylas formicarius TaxID=197179 RepID=UPI0029589FF0|nr:cytochrome P450 306a1 [Cylas formicarius]XP_060528011.1 cytochrome P450 306a1 [Cylas formicarius]XP_060528012.1 cytochrome P450 306a1 [Cylas formicarius]
MLGYLLLTVALVLVAFHFWKRRYLPPGPYGLPIVGYLPWLNPKSPYLTLTDLSKKYGSIYGLNLGSVYTVVLTNPKTIRTTFSKDATTGRAPLYLTHGIMKGYGLICAEGNLWKDQRKFIHSCLRNLGGSKISPHKGRMEALIMKHVLEFVEWAKETNEEFVDPLEPLRHSVGSIMNTIVFGRTWSRDDETWKWLQHLQEEGIKHIGVAGPLNFLPFLRFAPTFNRTMRFLIQGKLKTHRFYQKVIDEERVSSSGPDGNLDTDTYTNLIQGFLIEREKRRDTDDFGRYYSDQQFYHLLADVFGAGLDTTLTTLRWFLLYMATRPDLQQKARDEISTVLGDSLLSCECQSKLPFVEACIAETQRIRSVVPLGIPHGTVSDIEIDGYRIPKGTMLVPLQWAIHMNDVEYKNSNEFNPYNFYKDGVFLKRDNFIPFQNGKRMCVGDELARMMLFLFCSVTLISFKLGLDDKGEPNLEGECGITLTPKSYRLKFISI